MTTASRAVERLISYRWDDWVASMDEARAAMSVLRTDPDLRATISDLHASGMLSAVVSRLPTYEITQLLGGACDASLRTTIRTAILLAGARATGGSAPVPMPVEHDVPWLFDLSFEIQNSLRRLGARFRATPFNETAFAGLIPSAFSDLLPASFRGGLSHNQVATLLASEEVNIFGVAKYARTVANRGASMASSALPNTTAEFPGLNLGLYAAHSSAWPDDNVRVLGMYYTSRAWTDDLRSAGCEFVFEAYRDVRSTGIFP